MPFVNRKTEERKGMWTPESEGRHAASEGDKQRTTAAMAQGATLNCQANVVPGYFRMLWQ